MVMYDDVDDDDVDDDDVLQNSRGGSYEARALHTDLKITDVATLKLRSLHTLRQAWLSSPSSSPSSSPTSPLL